MTIYWINSYQYGLTFQIHDSSHKTMITPIKQFKVNYETQISIN